MISKSQEIIDDTPGEFMAVLKAKLFNILKVIKRQ